jgi:DNA repair protein RadA/Sms
MAAQGLLPVTNPSRLFLGQERERDPGAVATCSLEGTRPLLVEVQALVARTNYSVPQRVSMGFDSKRLTVLLALLDRFAGVEIGVQDVFMSVAGGFRLDEPAVDLAVAAAVAGSHLGRRASAGAVALGELGLNGELRPVPQLGLRLREAERLGLMEAVIPAALPETLPKLKMKVHKARNLSEALEMLGLR